MICSYTGITDKRHSDSEDSSDSEDYGDKIHSSDDVSTSVYDSANESEGFTSSEHEIYPESCDDGGGGGKI